MDTRPDLALNKCDATNALSPPAHHLHLSILTTFTDTGRPPTRADLARAARAAGIDVETALDELTRRDVVAVDERGEVRAAYPFSPTPTAHLVTWAGGPTVHAMCAVDALGMSAMLDRPVTITSTEPGTGAAITIQVDHDQAVWHPDTAVVFAGATGDSCCPSVDRTCGHINFFTTADAAHAWAAAHPEITGVVLARPDALASGIAEFGTFLQPVPKGGHVTEQTNATELDEFDHGWLAAIEQTPFVKAIIALSGLTRLGEHPASLDRLAAIIDRPVDETAALVRREFTARIEGGLIYWDDPYPGNQTRRTVYIGDREVAMGSGCGPDVFTFVAVFDVPFRVEETCRVTGTPIRVDFVPGGYERVDPPEAVTVLLHPNDFNASIGGHFAEINANVCTYQPFFASAEAAEPALAARPGSRAFTVKEMLERPWFTEIRDTMRPLIHQESS